MGGSYLKCPAELMLLVLFIRQAGPGKNRKSTKGQAGINKNNSRQEEGESSRHFGVRVRPEEES